MAARRLLILAGITVLVLLLVVVTGDEERGIPGSGSLLFPELLEKINEIQAIELSHAKQTITIRKVGSRWQIEEKNAYQADYTRVRQFLLGLAALERVESKTSKSERYAKLGLVASVEKDPPTRVRLRQQLDKRIFTDVLFGKRAGAGGYYILLGQDPQVWLVQGKLVLHKQPRDWLDRELLSLDRKRIRQVDVEQGKSGNIRLKRASPDKTEFVLIGMKPNEKPSSGFSIQSLANTFARLSLDDVAKSGDVSNPPFARIRMATFDGLEVSMAVFEYEQERWVKLSAAQVESDPQKNGQAQGSGTAKSMTPKQVKREVSSLNERWSGWRYRIADHQLDSILKKRSDLVEMISVEKKTPSNSKSKK